MEFRLLGPFEVWNNCQLVEISGSKRRALLALLALRANEVVRSELLVDALWGENPPRNAASALQTHISRLRKTLGADAIARREWGYVLRAAPAEIDLRRFEGLVAEAEQLAAKDRARKLTEALALWRGLPLADLVNEPALERDIARLGELRLSTVEQRIDAELEAGQNTNVTGELETLIAEHPLREHLRWLLILSLYRAGRQAEALEVYRETRRVLTEELGLEPSSALKELELAILRQDPSLDAKAAPTPTEPVPVEPEPKRRRIPPVPILALLALGLAGTATAIALLRPEKGTSSAAATGAIYLTLPMTGDPATGSGDPTDETKTSPTTGRKTRPANGSRTRPTTEGKTSPATTAKNHPGTAASAPANQVSSSGRTTTVGHKTNKSAPVGESGTLGDNFNGPTLDTQNWQSGGSGSGTSLTVANGQLVFSIPADATADPQSQVATSYVGTKCGFPGAFNARVQFSLLQWPLPNTERLWFGAVGATQSERIERVFGWGGGEGYRAWPVGDFTGQIHPVIDPGGTLRITRSHGILHVYYLHYRRWKELGRTPFNGEISLQIGLEAYPDASQAKEVSAAFDNFRATTPYLDCPDS